MKFRVDTVGHFEKEAKRLKKKFPSLKSEINNLIGILEENPETGTPLGNGFYKIRLAIQRKRKAGRRQGDYLCKSRGGNCLFGLYMTNQKSPISVMKN